jgi:lipoprotein-anchoring transpeptidase ErfK/SrfK
MRLFPVATVAVSLALLGAGGSATVRAMNRASSFQHNALALERTWTEDAREGVPESGIAPLHQDLERSEYMHASGWSLLWWTDDGSAFLTRLHRQTAAVWSSSMATARSRADGVMTAWSQMELQYGAYVPEAASRAAASWTASLAAARIPLEINTLATTWSVDLGQVRKAAELDEVTVAAGPYGGVAALVARAQSTLAQARADNLATGAVPSLVATLSAHGTDPAIAPAAIKSLATDLTDLASVIKLDGSVATQLRSLAATVQLATTHNAAGASGFATQTASLATALHSGGTALQLHGVAAQIATLERSVKAALTAVGCGHDVPNGKVIDVDLATQEAVFYDDGCIAGQSAVTTGRAGLRTPLGTYHIYAKYSPITFISPWPTSSPYYYTPEHAEYGMLFRSGGFFIHDAPWEPSTAFGPGSENTTYASHGCVHMPTPTMAWLYGWSPIGTTVIIAD